MKPIIALDFSSRYDVEQFLKPFKDTRLFVKVGMELYLQEGPDIVRVIKGLGHQIFLDLKLHDIPNTVHKAMKGLAKLDIDMTNVHAAGGREMMKAALEGLSEGTSGPRPRLIAVTQLTSISESIMRDEQNIQTSLEDSVVRYAQLAHESGLDGVVCSALEANVIRRATADTFLRITPGIRLRSDAQHDQKRVTTVEDAKAMGSSAMVIGRSITHAAEPLHTYLDILNTWEASV
jgi:orotidine-5'-phosphate decarboxylase